MLYFIEGSPSPILPGGGGGGEGNFEEANQSCPGGGRGGKGEFLNAKNVQFPKGESKKNAFLPRGREEKGKKRGSKDF